MAEQFEFSVELQEKILSMMLNNAEFLIQGAKYLEPHYFRVEPLSWLCGVIVRYREKYHSAPTADVVADQLKQQPQDKQLEYLSEIKKVFQLNVSEDEYLKDVLKDFVRRNIFRRGWDDCAKTYNTGDPDAAYDQMMETVNNIRDVDFKPPDRSLFFDAYEDRKERRFVESMMGGSNLFPTGIPMLDEITNGGLSRGEVGLLFGDAKKGKSIGLVHMGFACLRARAGRVLHIVLEGSRKLVEDRYEARFAEYNYHAIRRSELDPSVEKLLRQEYQQLKGWLVVQGMVEHWEYTVPDIEDQMRELASQGFVADLIIVDYGDLLSPRRHVEDTYQSQQQVFRDLKILSQKAYGGRMVGLWSATQATRAKKAGKSGLQGEEDPEYVLRSSEMADSYAKRRIVDLILSINQTIDEKVRGEMRLCLDTYRDNDSGVIIPTKSDFTRMIFHTNKPDFRTHYRPRTYGN